MARKQKSLGEKVAMSALAAFGDHLWEQNPEVRQLANAFGFTHAMPRKRHEREPDEEVAEKKPRKPKQRWTEPTPEESSGDDVIELVKKEDGSFGPR
jgi:hypothetical protein